MFHGALVSSDVDLQPVTQEQNSQSVDLLFGPYPHTLKEGRAQFFETQRLGAF